MTTFEERHPGLKENGIPECNVSCPPNCVHIQRNLPQSYSYHQSVIDATQIDKETVRKAIESIVERNGIHCVTRKATAEFLLKELGL